MIISVNHHKAQFSQAGQDIAFQCQGWIEASEVSEGFLVQCKKTNVSFSAACGGELNAPSGTISSPNYPNLYPHSRVCRWELRVQAGRRITLTINDLRLEGSGTSCAFDYVDVS